jgi:CheY-like chemotaxis protein
LPNHNHLRLVTSRTNTGKTLLRPSGEPLHVLIVEDEGMVAATLTDIVEDCGGRVVGMITTGLASIGAASGIRPDVIVMDVGLPGMDGIDAAAIIRARYPTPMVFISGSDIRAEVARRLIDLRGVETLVKPIDQNALCEAIQRALSAQGSQ